MSKLKKITAFLIAVSMILVMAACGAEKKEAIKPVVIIGPMECEIHVITEALEDVKISTVGNATLYTGTYKGIPVVAIHSLIGMVNASAVTTYAINELNPSMVIIQGTAGGHNPDLHQGDIVLGQNLVETGSYYSPHRDYGEGSLQADWDYPGVEMLSENGEIERVKQQHSTKELLDTAQNVEYEHGKLVLGTHGSADQWNKELDLIKAFHEGLGTDCEEMEGFAVAQVCAMYDMPFLAIRIISNSELYPEEEFSEKFGEYCQEYTLDVVEQCMSQTK